MHRSYSLDSSLVIAGSDINSMWTRDATSIINQVSSDEGKHFLYILYQRFHNFSKCIFYPVKLLNIVIFVASCSVVLYCMEGGDGVQPHGHLSLLGSPMGQIFVKSVILWDIITPIARFMGPTWGPSGADRTQVGPMLAPWTLLSG